MKLVSKRLLMPLALRGNIGKSTTLALLGQWLNQKSIPWNGLDWDADHCTFSRLFPEQVSLCEISEEPMGEVIKNIRKGFISPVSLWDPRAHFSNTIMDAWQLIKFQEAFAEEGGRITALVFPNEDIDVLDQIDLSIQKLGDSVDYLIIKNRARALKTRMFDGSELELALLKLEAKTMEIPALLSLARNQVAALEVDLGRGLTHVEAVGNKEVPLDSMVRHIISDWLKGIFRDFERVSECLLPTNLLKPSELEKTEDKLLISVRRGAKINRNNL